MKRRSLIPVFLLAAIAVPAVWAGIPNIINFQGRVTDASGNPSTSPTTLVLRLYASETNGSELYTESQTVTPDGNGIYSINIGAVTALTGVDFNQDLWLSVTVNGETLSPRYRLTSSPYAMRASTANSVDWSNITNVPAGFSDGTDNTGAGAVAVEKDTVAVVGATSNINFLTPLVAVDAGSGRATVFLNGSSVTLAGNTFNGVSQLVKLDGTGKLPVLDGSALTGVAANSIAAANVSAGSLGPSVIASSIAVNAVQDTSIVSVSGSKVGSGVPAANVAAGSLGASVIASSVAVNAIHNAQVSDVDASKLTGTINNARLDVSSVTLQANTFNSTSQLVKLSTAAALVWNGGNPISKHLAGSASLDFGATGAGTCESLTINVPGATDGDTVSLGVPAALAGSDTYQVFFAYVSGSNAVTVKRCNLLNLLTALSNPAAATVWVDVWEH